MCSGKDARIQVKRSLSFDSATALAVGIYAPHDSYICAELRTRQSVEAWT